MTALGTQPSVSFAHDGTMLELLRNLYRDFEAQLPNLETLRRATGEINAKGDAQRGFDVAAHDWVKSWLIEHCDGGLIESEEATEGTSFGPSGSGYRFVVDPVDGSDNFARGLPLAALSVAVLPREASVGVETVLAALVGDAQGGWSAIAERGVGSFSGTEQLATSGTARLEEAAISCELNHWAPPKSFARVIASVRAVRCYGCASRAISLVASGRLDAHVDVRGRLTPESFLAAARVLEEAGGALCTARGQALGPFQNIRERTTLVAAATKELANEIVEQLGRDE